MRILFSLFVALLVSTALAQEKDAPATTVAPAIRTFPIPTIAALGKEIYRRDAMAATAFDTLFETNPDAKKAPIRGWITDLDKQDPKVFFIQEQTEGAYTLAYIAHFPEKGLPTIEKKSGATLPEFVAKRYAARLAAIQAITNFMAKSYNFEVLDAPDGRGYLVYALASTHDPEEVMLGGHYRVSVSSDAKVQQVDVLSRSLLIARKHTPDMPKDAVTAGLSMSHIVSDTPVETHVYLSFLHRLPLFVATSEHTVWIVNEDAITIAKDEKGKKSSQPSKSATPAK